MAKFYKVLDKSQNSCFGGNHFWEVGKWYEVSGELIPCQNGFHFCQAKDLLKWIGEEIWEAQVEGEVIDFDDKLIARRARITRRCNWDKHMARLFAVQCAQDVAHLIPEPKAQRCIEVAWKYVSREASYEELVTAQKAAWEAAQEAIREAACDDVEAAAIEVIWVIAREPAWAAAMNTAWAAAWATVCATVKAEAGTIAWADAWAADRENKTKD